MKRNENRRKKNRRFFAVCFLSAIHLIRRYRLSTFIRLLNIDFYRNVWLRNRDRATLFGFLFFILIYLLLISVQRVVFFGWYMLIWSLFPWSRSFWFNRFCSICLFFHLIICIFVSHTLSLSRSTVDLLSYLTFNWTQSFASSLVRSIFCPLYRLHTQFTSISEQQTRFDKQSQYNHLQWKCHSTQRTWKCDEFHANKITKTRKKHEDGKRVTEREMEEKTHVHMKWV